MERVIRVAHFYHWTLSDVRRLRVSDFEMCARMLPKLNAERRLVDMSVAQYPHSKDQFRKKLHKEFMADADPRDPDAPLFSTEDLARLLAGGGNG
jgi:uncharacterized protein YecE (DUF72 family)